MRDLPDDPPPASDTRPPSRTVARTVEPPERGSGAAPGSDRLAFLREFMHNPFSVASVIPSSRWLEQRLVRETRADQARVVVELGPGTGGTTRAILRAMPPDSRLLAIELSTTFAQRLRQTVKDPRLVVVNGSAEHLGEFLAEHGLAAPDAVFSGIPFSTMPVEVGERIAAAVAASLAPGGRFVAYQATAQVARRTTPLLGRPRHAWELCNIPPLQVFTWTRPPS